MNKKTLSLILIPVFFILVVYLLANYTMQGRILSLYAFGAFKAPISTKIDCVQDTNQKVSEKFNLPLAFDQQSKDSLREFWHFSYYRACLFKQGYDFYGSKVLPSELSKNDQGVQYTNHFAKISFAVPADTEILADNLTDPDIDDYIITSILRSEGKNIYVQIDRSQKDLKDLTEVEKNFTGFSTSTATIIDKKSQTNQAGAAILAVHQDDANFGLLSFTPEHLVITVYGEKLPDTLLQNIENSFTFLSK